MNSDQFFRLKSLELAIQLSPDKEIEEVISLSNVLVDYIKGKEEPPKPVKRPVKQEKKLDPPLPLWQGEV